MLWTARGKSRAEVGQILGCSEHVVAYQLRVLRKMFGVRSREGAEKIEQIIAQVSNKGKTDE